MGYGIPDDHHQSLPKATTKPEPELKPFIECMENHSDSCDMSEPLESAAAFNVFKFMRQFKLLAKEVQQNSANHGFWEGGVGRNQPEMICLMHSELTEALEAIRHGNPVDQHCPEFLNLEVELADCVIRIMDFSAGFGLDVAGAIIAKHEFNKTRPMKHGKKF